MSQSTGVLGFSIALIILVGIVIAAYILAEKRRKKNISKSFKTFSENYQIKQKNMRAVPRVKVPEPMEIVLTLTDNDYFGLKAYALDISLTGFSVKPAFPLKKLPLNTLIKNVLVVTPINTFAIKEMKTIRIDHQIDKRLMAFHIMQIDVDQFENLKQFMNYLDEFRKSQSEDHEA